MPRRAFTRPQWLPGPTRPQKSPPANCFEESHVVTHRPTPTRRTFLKAASAAALAAPTIVRSSVFAKDDQPAASDRVVVGSIGTGDLGRRHHLANHLIPNKRIQMAAVCDVDRNHRDQAALDVLSRTGKRVDIYKDFRDLCDRQDIDAVLIAVPDHWHALIAIYAMQSGKDVYCEKPLTLTIAEGKKMVEVARRYGAVFQTGSQQRSDRRFRQACELVRNGKIGKLQRVDTYIGDIDAGSWQPVTTPPAELDWNFWLGPAPYADYSPNRCHYQFRWFSDYSGGKMTDWGAHHNDIAQWGIGTDGSGPVKVKGEGKFHENGPHDVPGTFDVQYTYAGGVELFCHAQGENGVKFTGADGWVFVSRGRIGASNEDILKTEFTDKDVRLYESRDHHTNWLDCIASRERPICDVEIGHRSCTICHLGNIAMRLGRELTWDPVKEDFVGDEQASRMVGKPMRAPWHL
ncbi:MAG: Gfo/Idh/MocA family oxidoreductase [Planctomycetia bacterium]|nr:Gfo/Idh/MocA family oxidoreductase [Planctomycetia bacterium]